MKKDKLFCIAENAIYCKENVYHIFQNNLKQKADQHR